MWHLPDDFDRRPLPEQQEIATWVRRVIISGSTDYRRFQAAAMRDRYALRFPAHASLPDGEVADTGNTIDHPECGGLRDAPRLIAFKTATLTASGYQRSGVWGSETATQKIEHLGLLFGALVSAPCDRLRGMEIGVHQLTFGLLVFPSVWDWYVQWRERRRGFYTKWEVDMLRFAIANTRKDFGWLRQSPHLADNLSVIAARLVEKAYDSTAFRKIGATDGRVCN